MNGGPLAAPTAAEREAEATRVRNRRRAAAVALLLIGAATVVFFWPGWSMTQRIVLMIVFAALVWSVWSGLADNLLKFLAKSGWAWAAALIWAGSWLVIWIDRMLERVELVDEPSAVAFSLGLVGVIIFTALLTRSETEGGGPRAAIAATFIIVFLLLIIDLLTIPDFRKSLSDVAFVEVNPATVAEGSSGEDSTTEPCPTPEPTESIPPGGMGDPTETPAPCVTIPEVAKSFVDGLFGVFAWAISLIIVSYFGAEAITTASENKKQRTYAENELDSTGQPLNREPVPPVVDDPDAPPPPGG